MSYIFDALNRFLTRDEANEKIGGQDRPPTTGETQAAPPDSDTAPPVDLLDEPVASDPATDGDDTFDHEAAVGPFPFEDHTHLIDSDSLVTDDRVVAIAEPSSIMSEEYRSIRTSMLARWNQKRHLVHTITSATPQEGKTITSLNLGFTFAELRNRRVVVLEADLRLPSFQKLISLPAQAGLVGLLEGQADLSGAVHRLADDRLHVITAGRRVNNEREVQLLSSSAMTSLIQKLRKNYDHVIIDTPPTIELADAGILGSASDEVLLIVRMNRTPRPLVEQAIRTLTNYNVVVGGLIATDQQRPTRRYYYSYKYGYGEGDGKEFVATKAA